MKYDSKYLCDTLGIDPGGVESIEEAQTDSGPFTTSRWRRGPRAAPPAAERGAKAKATR